MLCFRPLIRGLSISSPTTQPPMVFSSSFRPLIRGLSISSRWHKASQFWTYVSVPSSGDYQFLLNWLMMWCMYTNSFRPLIRGLSISSQIRLAWLKAGWGFRPLIRGLSISSTDVCRCRSQPRRFRPLIRGLSISSDILCPANLGSVVSVPSSGDYQFLLGTVVLGAAIG